MKIPAKLYKYQSFNTHSIENLKNQRIFFSSPTNFNDPFDCAFIFKEEPITEQHYLDLYKKYHADILKDRPLEINGYESKYLTAGKLNDSFKAEVRSGTKKAFEERRRINRNEKGVACFSSKNNDILMWAHYADGHRGFCLEFDTSYDLFRKALKVDYKPEIPHISAVDDLLHSDNMANFLKLITVKSECWKYESEWRIPHVEKNKLYGYDSKSLTGIYFGSEMDPTHIEIIALILQGQNPDVQLYEGKKSDKTFSVKFDPVNYTPYINKDNKQDNKRHK